MKSLFSYADAYIKNCTWKDLALVKFCLCAIGVMIGLSVPKEKRKIPFLGSLLVFLVTYFPLMGKFIRVIKVERKKQKGRVKKRKINSRNAVSIVFLLFLSERRKKI